MKNTTTLLPILILFSIQTAKTQCDTIFSFAHAGLNPTGITFDGTYLWCNNSNAPKFIYRFDLLGQLIDSIPSPAKASYCGGDMEFDGTHILLCAEQDGILYKLDPVTGVVVSQFNLPINVGNISDPNNWGIAFDGTYLWHSEYTFQNSFHSILYKLDATNGTVLNSFILEHFDLCIKFINGTLYGLDPIAETLHRIDTSSGNYLSTEPWCLGYSLGMTFADNHVWASHYSVGSDPNARIFQFDGHFFSTIQTAHPEITCTLYPNPVSNQLHIQLSDAPSSGLRIEIGNLHDQKMHLLLDQDTPLPEQSFDFDLSGLPAGIYLVKILAANALALKTVVKM